MSAFDLYQWGDFTLHSGDHSNFLINCDALSDPDVDACAHRIVEACWPFGAVFTVPSHEGSVLERLSKAVMQVALGRRFAEGDVGAPILLLDDVLTTGASMDKMRQYLESHEGIATRGVKGAVLFARGPCPAWVFPVFVLTSLPQSA